MTAAWPNARLVHPLVDGHLFPVNGGDRVATGATDRPPHQPCEHAILAVAATTRRRAIDDGLDGALGLNPAADKGTVPSDCT